MKYILIGLFAIALIWQARTPADINNSVVYAEASPVQAQLTSKHIEASPQLAPTAEPEEMKQPQPVTVVGCEHYRHLIEQYNWNVDVFLAIAKAESGCNPLAVGDTNPIRGVLAPSCGLFQVRTLSSRPSCEALKDPATNIAWAYRIYQGQGYGAWSVCKAKVDCR